jgi:hypothetical protein
MLSRSGWPFACIEFGITVFVLNVLIFGRRNCKIKGVWENKRGFGPDFFFLKIIGASDRERRLRIHKQTKNDRNPSGLQQMYNNPLTWNGLYILWGHPM